MSPSPEDPRPATHYGYGTVTQSAQHLSPYQTPYPNTSNPRPPVDAQTYDTRSPYGTPQQRPSHMLDHRHSSTPHMDTLADLASAQQHQQPRSSVSVATQGADVRPESPSVLNARLLASPNHRTHSASDLVMAEAPSQTTPSRVFTATSLSEADLQTITELTSYLAEHSYDYNSHVQLINLLHQGLVSHLQPPAEDGSMAPNSSDYPLLADLRQAREAMDSRFAIGEDLWKDWIDDEALLAKSSEERSAVVELCRKAVQEEIASVTLWKAYGDYIWSTYAGANGLTEGNTETWSEEDKMICSEVFPKELVLSVWEQAASATKWRIDESHLVWNRYAELAMQDVPENPSPKTVEEIRALFMMRLQVPQSAWEATSQAFWPFISKHNQQDWEEIMSATNEMAGPAKQQFALREPYELEVHRALQSGDNAALHTAFSNYLAWETKRKRKHGPFDNELRCALYERALLRFPTVIDWWLDYVELQIGIDSNSATILPLVERATRHCPWSGELWSRRLLRVEIERMHHDLVEGVKHKATNSGLLDTGGMEEMLKVHSAWCGYLRRRAFGPDSTDDDIDMADMGINGVLEDVQVIGEKLYGKEFQGDPLWRIEKIYIKFLGQAVRIDEARAYWRLLVPKQGNSYDFWLRWYYWEMFVWSAARSPDTMRLDLPENMPDHASDVLRQAMKQRALDWPEKVHEIYAHHFGLHATVEEVQKAEIELRSAQKYLKQRREQEAAEVVEAAATAAQESANSAEAASEDINGVGKRKREVGIAEEDVAMKRSKVTEPEIEPSHLEASSSASAQAKRDREHNTVTVKDLPADVTEHRLRQFFQDCGNMLSVSIITNSDAMTANATIEFETHEDTLAAKTRHGKSVDGNTIRVQAGTLSTLYVTNYPPDYDEIKIRELFKDFGTIVSVRFPSLKYNQRRRFCYVQFLTTEEARAATVMNDKAIDGQHNLIALISDPDAKKNRAGATAEGRELWVGNVEHGATEQEIKEFFEQKGHVESVRMLRNAGGKFTGTAFVIYSTAVSRVSSPMTSVNANSRHRNKPLALYLSIRSL